MVARPSFGSSRARQRALVVTNDGKPIAILSATDAESFEASLRNLRRARVVDALSGLQRQAERRGLDRLTLDDVHEEIQASRKDRQER